MIHMEIGDIIKIDYECWIKDTNKLFTTTQKNIAEEHDIFDEKKTYEPEIVIVGAGRAIKGLEDSLKNAEVGKEYEIEVKPDEAFGKREPKLTELHKIHKLRRMKIEPYEGLEVEIEGRKGTIIRVTGSRVRIDFNNPLAGKTLKYKYSIIEKAENLEEKIQAIIDLEYRRGEEFEFDINEKEITLKLPLFCKTDKEWFNLKLKIVADLRKHLEFETITFLEEYVSKKPKEEIEVSEEEKNKEETEEETFKEESEDVIEELPDTSTDESVLKEDINESKDEKPEEINEEETKEVTNEEVEDEDKTKENMN